MPQSDGKQEEEECTVHWSVQLPTSKQNMDPPALSMAQFPLNGPEARPVVQGRPIAKYCMTVVTGKKAPARACGSRGDALPAESDSSRIGSPFVACRVSMPRDSSQVADQDSARAMKSRVCQETAASACISVCRVDDDLWQQSNVSKREYIAYCECDSVRPVLALAPRVG